MNKQNIGKNKTVISSLVYGILNDPDVSLDFKSTLYKELGLVVYQRGNK